MLDGMKTNCRKTEARLTGTQYVVMDQHRLEDNREV